MNCAGHHRNLGPSITRVRSVKLDSWKNDFIEMMEGIGNGRANAYFEKNLPSSKKADASWQTNDIRKFIQDKYVKKLFAPLDRDPPVAIIGKDASPKKAQFDGFRGFDQPAPRSSTPQKHTTVNQRMPSAPTIAPELKKNTSQPDSNHMVRWDSFDMPTKATTTTEMKAATVNQTSKRNDLLDVQSDAIHQFSSMNGTSNNFSMFETFTDNNKSAKAADAFKQFHSVCGPSNKSMATPTSNMVNPLLQPQNSWPKQPPTVSHFAPQAAPIQENKPSITSFLDLYDKKDINIPGAAKQDVPLITINNEPTNQMNQFMSTGGGSKPEDKQVQRGNYQFLETMGRMNQFQSVGGMGALRPNGGMNPGPNPMMFGSNQPVRAQYQPNQQNMQMGQNLGGMQPGMQPGMQQPSGNSPTKTNNIMNFQ